MTAPVQVFLFWARLLSWAVCQTCGRRDAALWRTPSLKSGAWTITYPDVSAGITCSSHALWQQKCPKEPWFLETAEELTLTGGDIYVSPQRRHWPVYDPALCIYKDASNYKPVEGDVASNTPDPLESLLDLSRDEAWALAPVRIFMDLKQERGKKTMACEWWSVPFRVVLVHSHKLFVVIQWWKMVRVEKEWVVCVRLSKACVPIYDFGM